MRRNAAAQYQMMSNRTGVESADSHRLIQMLFEGALSRIATAKGHIVRNEIEKRGLMINKAIGIVSGLQNSLDFDRGGELSFNLDRLYDYINRRLFQANSENNAEILDEVTTLLLNIKSGWDQIREEAIALQKA